MGHSQLDFAALIGSRICHDLISPIGAINNGLELLGLSGDPAGPELGLISDSVGSASARIRFFRIAYGAPGEQQVPQAEIEAIFADLSAGARMNVLWNQLGGAPRSEVRMAFLALQCIEAALPYGGDASVMQEDDGTWVIHGHGRKVNADQPLWSLLAGSETAAEIQPANVQFPLLAVICRDAGRALHTELGETEITIRL